MATIIKKTSIQERLSNLLTGRDGILVRDVVDKIDDHDWIKESPTTSIRIGFNDIQSKMFRFHSTADSKPHTTGIGRSTVINPLPQFTRYADTRSVGIGGFRPQIDGPNNNIGMGLYYSEAIDDTQQKIYMQMGVPEFNSLFRFFTSFYDHDMARLARTASVAYDVGYTISKVISIVFLPVAAAVYMAKMVHGAVRLITNKPLNRYYYHREAMHTYWMSVNYMLNEIANYARITPWRNSGETEDNLSDPEVAGGSSESGNLLSYFRTYMPGLISEEGFIDVVKLVSVAQAREMKLKKQIVEGLESLGISGGIGTVTNFEAFYNNLDSIIAGDTEAKGTTIKELMDKFFSSPSYSGGGGGESSGGSIGSSLSNLWTSIFSGDSGDEAASAAANEARLFDVASEKSFLEISGGTVNYYESKKEPSRMEIVKANSEAGGMWLTLRVDSTESVTESFNNTTTESDISQKFNSASGAARNASFDLAGGNIDGGMLTGIVNGIKGLLQGTLNNIGFGGLIGLAGAAFVDIPKHWDNSSANLPEMRYTMTLVSPYGNPLSHLLYVDLPICCLLAAALPLAAGPQSYTSPFLVKVFDRGKAQTRLGLISDLSITRGITNLGFDKEKRFLGAEISFTVQDLSTVVAAPLAGHSASPLGFLKQGLTAYSQRLSMEDSNFYDYLQVLAACDPSDSMYGYKRLNRVLRMAGLRAGDLTDKDKWTFVLQNMVSSNAVLDTIFYLMGPGGSLEDRKGSAVRGAVRALTDRR